MIILEKITWDNWQQCIRLKVKEEQEDFIATNMYSLAQSYVSLLNEELPPMSYAMCKDGTVVGFVMMYHETADQSDYSEESYGICRFMIGKEFQGKGYGKEAFAKVLDHIKTYPQGDAKALYLSYTPENEVARKLYASFGFIETGDIDDGEVVARLAL